jgi:hypothetical protein
VEQVSSGVMWALPRMRSAAACTSAKVAAYGGGSVVLVLVLTVAMVKRRQVQPHVMRR